MITKLQVKYIQSLGQKKFRDQAGVFVAEGPKIINELLGAGGLAAETIYATAGWMTANLAILKKIAPQRLTEVNEQELERLSFLQTPNEVIGVFKKPAGRAVNIGQTLSIMLDGIQDPGNMGTIIRIADWFGIQQVTCSTDCADAFAPRVVQSTMGSLLRVQLVYTDLLTLVKETPQLQLYAATLHGKSLYGQEPIKKGVLVIGNESKGISPDLLSCCQHLVTIPRLGQAESLNAAVATGIILSHLV